MLICAVSYHSPKTTQSYIAGLSRNRIKISGILDFNYHKLNDLLFQLQVLERITDTTVATELEVLIGLSSQICHVVPEDFARELEHDQMKERFVKKLVEALNANVKPTVHCPRIRRVIVEQVIYMMENNSSYANCFNECQMMEALMVVEETPSKVEKYRLFMGDAGLMEYSIPLSNLVTRAKEELMRHVT